MVVEANQKSSTSAASLELLFDISRKLASALELRVVLQRVLDLIIENIGGSNGSLIVLDEDGNPMDSIIFVDGKVIEETTEQLRFTLDKGLAGWVFRERETALVEDTSQDDRWIKPPSDKKNHKGPKSALSVPLILGDEILGIMTLTHPDTNFFKSDHLELVEAIAAQAAVAVLNGRLYEKSRRRGQTLSAIASSTSAISASLNIDEVLQSILAETTNALNVEAVSLALIDEDDQKIVFRAATGAKSASIIGLRIDIGKGIAGWVAKTGTAVIVPEAHDDPRFYASADQNTGFRTHAIACAPIRSQGTMVGVLEAINPKGRSFIEDDLAFLEGIGNIAGAAIEHAQLFEQVELARSRYLELFEDSVDSIFITDLDGNIMEVNLQALELTGFSTRELEGMSIHHFHQADWKILGTDLENIESGETLSYESTLQGAKGEDVFVDIYVHRIDVEGKQYLQWILRDITERHNLDTLREDLASMIFHDLRSPLANIVSGLGVLEMMLPADNDPAIRSVLDIAMRSTERVQRLATSLLDTSRMEAGQTVGSPTPIDLSEITSEAIEANLPVADSRKVKLSGAFPKKLPKVMVDGEMIKRVIINLIENALKYSDEESKISLGAKRDGEWVRVWVADEGRGIAPDEQKRIFEKFTRVRSGSKGNTKGLGLGLAYCKLAVEGHGGKIWAESEAGKGAKFIFTIPTV